MGGPAAQPALEAEYLRLLNVARADPAAYGRSVGVDLSYIAPRPPLVRNDALSRAARLHVEDMFVNRYASHTDRQGRNAIGRAQAQGYTPVVLGESLGGAYPTADRTLADFVIDAGIPDFGHRHEQLGHGDPWSRCVEVGVGFAGPAPPELYIGYACVLVGLGATPPVPPPPPPPSPGTGGVTFLARDDAAKGDGVGRYSTQLALQSTALEWTWAAATTDPRALPVTTRSAKCRYGDVVEGTVAVPGPGKLALYFVDYDSTARSQRVEILDPTTRAVLDRRDLTGFNGGAWLEWGVPGPVVVRLTRTAGANAVVSGVYFTPVGNG